jgi:hypothetical protein
MDATTGKVTIGGKVLPGTIRLRRVAFYTNAAYREAIARNVMQATNFGRLAQILRRADDPGVIHGRFGGVSGSRNPSAGAIPASPASLMPTKATEKHMVTPFRLRGRRSTRPGRGAG